MIKGFSIRRLVNISGSIFRCAYTQRETLPCLLVMQVVTEVTCYNYIIIQLDEFCALNLVTNYANKRRDNNRKSHYIIEYTSAFSATGHVNTL